MANCQYFHISLPFLCNLLYNRSMEVMPMNHNDFIDYQAEVVVKQFEKRCLALNEKYQANIDPDYYISQFNNFSSAIRYFADLQEQLYMELKTKYPNLDFGIRGRSKTAFSYFNKVLEKLRQNPFELAEVQDLFANKVFVRSLDFPIDTVTSYYDGSFSIHSGLHELDLIENDALVFNTDTQISTKPNVIVLRNLTEQVIKEGPNIFIKDLDTGVMRNLAHSTLKRSNKNSLIPYLYDMEEVSNEFYSSKGFKRCKIKDYIATPKPSGYSSLQDSFYSSKLNLSIETQFKTEDMERASKEDPKQARNTYKKGSRDINENTLYQVPHYALTTCTYDKELKKVVPITYIPSDDKCLEYTFHITKEDYLAEMALQARIKMLQKQLTRVTSDAQRFQLQSQIEELQSQSLNQTKKEEPSR